MVPTNRLFAEVATCVRTIGTRPPHGHVRHLRELGRSLDIDSLLKNGEESADWQRFHKAVSRALRPQGVLEVELAAEYASCLWRLRQLRNLEVAIVAQQLNSPTTAAVLRSRDTSETAYVRRRLEEVTGLLEILPTKIKDYEAQIAGLERFRKSSETTELSGDEAYTFLSWVHEDFPNHVPYWPDLGVDLLDETFLANLGHANPSVEDPYAEGPWTIGMLWRGMQPLIEASETDRHTLLAIAISHLECRISSARAEIPVLQKKLPEFQESIRAVDADYLALVAVAPPQIREEIGRHETRLMRLASQIHKHLREVQDSRGPETECTGASLN